MLVVVATGGVVVANGLTVTVSESVVVPPGPPQARVYVVVAVGVTISLPDRALDPDHPLDAMQKFVFVELHVNVEDAVEDAF